jgi:peptidoglycan hydrolase-like protein with peptidoglycan-binding domain
MSTPTPLDPQSNHLTLAAWRPGVDALDVLELQQRLQDKGFDPGGIDGHFGGLTQMAIYRFQFSRNLAPTGSLDCVTWQSLWAV